MTLPTYAVLVPVKPPSVGKSRLVGLADDARPRLAEAFALDTVAACLGAASVGALITVTDDARLAAVLTSMGSVAIPDGVTGDLNATLRQAAAEAGRRWPSLMPVAICADLPALRSADLDQVLATAPPGRPSFVADAAGLGTTLYLAPAQEFEPRFGPDSRRAHVDAGVVELTGAGASVRRDVDDLTDLHDAIALGVGPATAAALALPA